MKLSSRISSRSRSSTKSSQRYNCKTGSGCSKSIFGKYRSRLSCEMKCNRSYYRCDKSKGCVLTYSDIPRDDKARLASEGLFATLEECQNACEQRYGCDCKGKCKQVFADAAATGGDETFALTEEGKLQCEQNPACIVKACPPSALSVVMAVLVGVLLLTLIAVIIYFASSSSRRRKVARALGLQSAGQNAQ